MDTMTLPLSLPGTQYGLEREGHSVEAAATTKERKVIERFVYR
jgi:hypothetical protein